MLKPFIVEIETAVIIMAEDEKAAEQWAAKNFSDLEMNAYDCDIFARRMEYYPRSWDKNCYPYGIETDKTLGEILETDEVSQEKLKEMREITEQVLNNK